MDLGSDKPVLWGKKICARRMKQPFEPLSHWRKKGGGHMQTMLGERVVLGGGEEAHLAETDMHPRPFRSIDLQ